MILNPLKKISLLTLFLSSFTVFSQFVGVIPQPNRVEFSKDSLSLSNEININFDNLNDESIQYLKNYLKTNLHLNTTSNSRKKYQLTFDKINAKAEESYRLKINKKSISIQSSSQEGYFLGMNSLLQLLNYHKKSNTFRLPQLEIIDNPKFVWRGFMLDEARHFFGTKKVKQLLNWMAFYKLNKFHWHLTDEQGWRIEIKQYPNLTKIGGIGNFFDKNAPAQFYTQEDIIEIVAYAKARQIDIIPEIDMPGHATAANRAYPQYSGGGTKEHPDFTFQPAKEETYQFLTNILKEVSALFPSQVIHLGGDEVAFGSDAWNNDPKINALKQKYNFTTNSEVERYFMKRMADSVYSLNSQLAVWDEMVDANLPTGKTIQYWWRHDKPEQLELSLKNGYPTVICPRIPFYFDFVQSDKHKYGRRWGEDYNPLDRLYNYDFTSAIKSEKYKGQILGVQANLWTERVNSQNRLDFMIFPRIAALAEVAWTNTDRKNFDNFLKVLENHTKLYKNQNIYFHDIFNDSNPEPKVESSQKKYIDNPK